MPLALPLALTDLADLLRLESATWNLTQQQEYSGLGSGEGISHDLAPPLWEAECQSVQLPVLEAERLRARLNALDGSNNAFLLFNPAGAYPATDPDGAILEGAEVKIKAIAANRKELSFKGVPTGLGLPWGAYASIVYGAGRYALVQLLGDVTANGSGETAMVEVRPHLRPGIAAEAAVGLIKPVAKVKIIPGSLRLDVVGVKFARVSFTARQTLAAN